MNSDKGLMKIALHSIKSIRASTYSKLSRQIFHEYFTPKLKKKKNLIWWYVLLFNLKQKETLKNYMVHIVAIN